MRLTVEERNLVISALERWASDRYHDVTDEVFDDETLQRRREEQYHADMRTLRSAKDKIGANR